MKEVKGLEVDENSDSLVMLIATAIATYSEEDEAEHLIRALRAAGYRIVKAA